MVVRLAPQVALVCFTLVDGALAVLTPAEASARSALWPTAALAATDTPDALADVLARGILHRAPAWRGQVGVLVDTQQGLLITYAAVMPSGTDAPDGYQWQQVPRGGGSPVVRAAVAFLRDRLDREPVAFRLLPPLFTLSELQQVYELLLERRLHKASFRRTLLGAHVVEPTDAWRSEGRGRPAQLFRFSPRRRRGVQRAVRFELLG